MTIVIGFILLALGAIFLLANLGLIAIPASAWSVIWPILLMGLGLYFLWGYYRLRNYKYRLLDRYTKPHHYSQRREDH